MIHHGRAPADIGIMLLLASAGLPGPGAVVAVRWTLSDVAPVLGGRAVHVDCSSSGAAVHVLTREAMHLGGRVDEGRAECAAAQRDAAAARILGADDVQARRLARTYWLVVRPTMPEPYRTPGCAAGQGLDEHLADAPRVQQG